MDWIEVYTEGLVLSTEKEVSRSVYLHDLKSHTCVVIFSTARSIVRVLKLRGVVSPCLGITRGIMLTLQTTTYYADLQKTMYCFSYDIRKWLMTTKIRNLMSIVNLGYTHDTVRPADPLLHWRRGVQGHKSSDSYSPRITECYTVCCLSDAYLWKLAGAQLASSDSCHIKIIYLMFYFSSQERKRKKLIVCLKSFLLSSSQMII